MTSLPICKNAGLWYIGSFLKLKVIVYKQLDNNTHTAL